MALILVNWITLAHCLFMEQVLRCCIFCAPSLLHLCPDNFILFCITVLYADSIAPEPIIPTPIFYTCCNPSAVYYLGSSLLYFALSHYCQIGLLCFVSHLYPYPLSIILLVFLPKFYLPFYR